MIAANIYVNSDIKDNVSTIAASSQDTTNEEENGDIALQIADLKNTNVSDTGNITINDYYSDMVTDLGSQINEAKNEVTNQQTLVNQLNSKKESVSGVSLDEETANQVLYQHAYDASAKIISVIDQMLDTIINMKD